MYSRRRQSTVGRLPIRTLLISFGEPSGAEPTPRRNLMAIFATEFRATFSNGPTWGKPFLFPNFLLNPLCKRRRRRFTGDVRRFAESFFIHASPGSFSTLCFATRSEIEDILYGLIDLLE